LLFVLCRQKQKPRTINILYAIKKLIGRIIGVTVGKVPVFKAPKINPISLDIDVGVYVLCCVPSKYNIASFEALELTLPDIIL